MLSKPFESTRRLLIAGACIFSLSCAKQTPVTPPQTMIEQIPPSSELLPTPETAKNSRPDLPPPKPAEVNEAVQRVFKDSVSVEIGRNPYFIVGDFNGDLSQDIAVVVKPAPGKLPEINDELANWILVDPIPAAKESVEPGNPAGAVRPPAVQVAEAEVLLAVIHGFESNGWRDQHATQTYVLKAAGDKLKAQAKQQVSSPVKAKKLPFLRGDVIEQTIGGKTGFLYYNGAKYAWYDPRSYKPEAPPRIIHGGVSAMHGGG